MKPLLIFILLSGIPLPSLSQESNGNQQVTPEAFQAEINKAIAAYPHGMQLYKESDNFERLIYAQVAHKLGLTMTSFSNISRSKDNEQSITNVSDLTPDVDDEDEASIAISRVNPNLIVAGANDLPEMNTGSMPVYVSTDAGRDWETFRLPIVSDAEVQAFGDPIVICDDSGIFYYSFLISSEQTSISDSGFISDLMVARGMVTQDNDSIHWTLGSPVLGNSVPALSSEDKETIAVDRDPSSPYYGRLYIAWTHFLDYEELDAERMISHSDDHGASWSKPVIIPTDYGYFALLRVGKGGDVFIGSSHRDSLTAAGTFHAMMVSRDGGNTFTQSIISSYVNYPSGDYLNELKGAVKAYPYINFDVDPSNNNLFAVYGTYDSVCSCAEQFAVTSTDSGATWSSPPKQIGTPGLLATDHFQPWVTFDPTTGKARIIMYSSEDDPWNNLLTLMVYFDFDNLTTPEALGTDLFNPNEVISQVAYVRGAPFIGDYQGADAFAGTFATAWTEKNPTGTDGDIFARVESPTGSVSITKINESNLALHDPSPNPATGNSILFTATSNVSSMANLTLFDLSGRADISTQFGITPGSESSVNLDIHSLCAGVYLAVLESDGKMVEKNLVILH